MRRILHFTQKAKAIANAQSVLGLLAQNKQANLDVPVKSKFVTWQDVKTWRDVNYVAPHQGPAFDMVRQILSEKPRTFHEIIDVGLELHAKRLAEPHPGSEAAEAAQRAVIQSRALSKKKRPENETTPRIPEGHPFISANFLKKRILSTLLSQDLVFKKPVRPVAGTVRADQLTADERSAKGSAFHWFLRLPPTTIKKTDPLGQWSIPTQWKRLSLGEFPGSVFDEHRQVVWAQRRLERERRLKRGSQKRTEEEIWHWDGRQPELTTRKQRFHLSARRQKTRTTFELRRLRERLRYDLARPEKERERAAVEAKAKAAEAKAAGKAEDTLAAN